MHPRDRRRHRFPRIDHDCMRSVMTKALDGYGPALLACYGLTDLAKVEQEGWSPETVEHVEDVLDAAFATHDASREASLLATFPLPPVMDRLLASVIRRLGVPLADLFAIATITGNADIEVADGTRIQASLNLSSATAVWHGHVSVVPPHPMRLGAYEHRLRIDLQGDQPDTVLNAFAGRPIEDMIRHPLTDGLGLVIHHVDRKTDVTSPDGMGLIVDVGRTDRAEIS